MIFVKNLKKNYGEKIVLDDISFEVEEGTIFALLGENGAGKTTTVRMLSTLIKYDAGQATIGGFDCMKDSSSVRKIISLTGQYAAVDELLTAEENLLMMGRLSGLDKRAAKKRTAELLEQFDLVEAANRAVKTFSGGMRRRVDIAISLLASPKVIFLDEPTTGLDPRSRMNMWKVIKDLSKKGVTIFLTTQYLEEAEQLADKIAVIHHGKVVVEGTANELKNIVGEEKIEFTFQEQNEVEKACKILKGRQHTNHVSIAVTSDGSTEKLRKSLNILHDHDIEPSAVHLIKPTLDDVFMNITSERTDK